MYKVEPTESFLKDVKFYVRKKKYLHIAEDIKRVTDKLENGELVGSALEGIEVSNNGHTYKVRSANTDTKSGESNGYRIIYYAISEDRRIFLLTIYSKKDSNRILTDKDIINLVKRYCNY